MTLHWRLESDPRLPRRGGGTDPPQKKRLTKKTLGEKGRPGRGPLSDRAPPLSSKENPSCENEKNLMGRYSNSENEGISRNRKKKASLKIRKQQLLKERDKKRRRGFLEEG